MKCAEPTVIEQPVKTPARKKQVQNPKPEQKENSVINLPMGLLGFERVKHFHLLGSAEEAPFLWLQMAEDPNLAFLVVPPSVVLESYQPDISDEEAAFLGLSDPEDALIFNIVTVHPNGQVTANLKGPIVINRRTLIGKQVVPVNASNYALQHPISAETAAAA